MEQKLLGELFGINVHSPIIRDEVREVLKRQLEFKAALQTEKALTEDQAFLEVDDIFEGFYKNISVEDKRIFEKIHSEEVNAAPREWFNVEGKSSIHNAEFLKAGNAGELFGVNVTYPFTRENIRTLVLQRTELMKSLANSKGISLYQASNDLSDIQNEFIERFNYEDQEKFLNIMTDEMLAHANATNDEAEKLNQQAFKQEISNINLTHTMGGIIVFCCLMFLFFVVFK
ncbi:hypothetical protein [Acinetobacter baumannii]|uniref:hypothetical protein n=1 Tax=Acinetobacter baumannii TaxID=470 RepID=UPI0010202B1B|nr:hypothetical protein [Acinetobacter baumannii]MDC4326772.1 hypothetical protein [Acinetobacter baumannii]MDC4393130.1 hypothetical protein [Acinetobacter baumannii]RYL19476.1 hypothetical protein EWO92_00295 [Acinetobacter baumannii]RYL32821.1 hypothetical protein EWO96_03520 [Acinetobacter baumannii]RYL45941.1 hypothetical protein EWP49_03520 [Acinetobacter baumannii]